jgi:hypothetical protein
VSKEWVFCADTHQIESYIRAAEALIQGELVTFAVTSAEFGRVPAWNRDPLTKKMAPISFGKMLNYRDSNVVGNIKYLWEQNRHLQLVTLAQAYKLTKKDRYLKCLAAQLESWMEQCPYLMGPNWTSALELGIRLINWSVVWQLVGGIDSPLFDRAEGERLRHRWLSSIYQHAHFIQGYFSRYSSANNHLIGEAAGLLVATLTWPYWQDFATWQCMAKAELEREALLQNGEDGVNREQAISYQQFVLDFLVIAALAGKANGVEFSQAYWNRIERMLAYLASVIDVDGNVPMIGDADDGYVVRLSQEKHFCPYRSLLAAGAVLFERGDFKAKAGRLDDKTRWLLGEEAQQKFKSIPASLVQLPVHRAFPEGGYYILGCNFETEKEIRLVVDAGPLGYLSIAAHGHADALSFTLSLGGHEFLIDPGTYAYHTKQEWRDYFRGTAAHNTVRVDDQEQSIIGGNFLWMKKAKAVCEVWEPEEEIDRFVGSHNGYLRLRDPVTHRREVVLHKGEGRIVVTDTLECKKTHDVEASWHFSEHCRVWLEGNCVLAANNDATVRMCFDSLWAEVTLHRGEASPPRGWVSRRFDVKEPITTAVARQKIKGTTRLTTEIFCLSTLGDPQHG